MDEKNERIRKILYGAWKNMIYRCDNVNHERYESYGARGIKITVEWYDFEVFYQWASESGHREGLSLERIDNDGNYTPSNCTWLSISDQNRNRRNVHEITINGETRNAEDWCRVYNLNPGTFRTRYNNYGWDIVRAITTPVKGRKNASGYKPDKRRKAPLKPLDETQHG